VQGQRREVGAGKERELSTEASSGRAEELSAGVGDWSREGARAGAEKRGRSWERERTEHGGELRPSRGHRHQENGLRVAGAVPGRRRGSWAAARFLGFAWRRGSWAAARFLGGGAGVVPVEWSGDFFAVGPICKTRESRRRRRPGVFVSNGNENRVKLSKNKN
jgi:hypothetical protein